MLQIEHLNNPKVVYIGRLDIYSEFNLTVYYKEITVNGIDGLFQTVIMFLR